MGEEMNVHGTRITRLGTDVQESRQTLQGHIDDFERKLASYGEVGGVDTLSSIAKLFIAEIKKVAFESWTENNGGLGEHGERYSAMGATYRHGEQLSTQNASTAI